MGPLIGKNSQLRSRSLDSLTACKFSSHSSGHRRRSYEFCRSACMARKKNCVIPLSQRIIKISYAISLTRCQAIDRRGLLRMPFRHSGALQKWQYSLGCPRELGENGPKRFARLCSRDRFPRDCSRSGSATVSTAAWCPDFAVKPATQCVSAVSVKSSSMAAHGLYVLSDLAVSCAL